ncbi:phage recombination protein Bet [Streptomyces sp. NPDC059538]|uniref:phage recombination protein Bet n=1 Tax=Streptomyces sp. NPDC059538 TaxID=3346860 RepID=UPI0036953B57
MSTDVTKAGGSLAIRPDQAMWSPEQRAVLMQSGISDQVTNAELASFLHLCQRTQLDPFSRQIYLIGRYNKKAGREVFTPQTGIDGYRVIAQRVSLQSGGTYGYEDTLWCGENGRWVDVWLAPGPPAAAKVTVIRNGLRFSAVALYSEYAQKFPDGNPKALWATMPSGQTAKCAEALALRKAFPHDLAGVYTVEEMAQADNAGPEERHLRSVQPGETDQWATFPQQNASREFVSHPAGQQHADDAAKNAQGKDHINARWKQAAAASVLDAKILAPDTKQPDELGAYLKRLGASLPDVAPPVQPGGDTVIDAVLVDEPADPEADYAAAVAELRAAAEAANLDDFENGAAQALGMSITDAPTEAIRALAAQIRPAA